MTGKPTDAEVFATTLPRVPWNGWYCLNHPPGETLANARTRDRCWGCGTLKPIQKEEPSMEEFKPGDIVRLKSGGPPMTIESLDRKEGGFLCLWFDEGQLEDAVFAAVVLVPDVPAPSTPVTVDAPAQPTIPTQS